MNEPHSALASLLPILRRGVPIAEVKATAARVAGSAEMTEALLGMLEQPAAWSKIQLQKAAWVLNHAFQCDERGFLPRREKLARVLDATEDQSALRELLKLLAHPVWIDVETEGQRCDMLDLAAGLMFVTDVPAALHYAAMQILHSRAQAASEFSDALEAMAALQRELDADSAPLKACIERHERRFRQKLARTKSPS